MNITEKKNEMVFRKLKICLVEETPVTLFASKELIKYLKEIDDSLSIDFMKSERVNKAFKNTIFIGVFDDILNNTAETFVTEEDAVSVEVIDGEGYISGSNEQSVLIAVYKFLKKIGCFWSYPGKCGERIPRKTLREINVSFYEKASYQHRGVCIEGADNYENVYDMIDYLPKVGMNEYFIQFSTPTVFFDRWYSHINNEMFQKEKLCREEISCLTESLEDEIKKRGLRYHKVGHGWTCEPFGIDGTSWNTMNDSDVPSNVRKYFAKVNGKRSLYYGIPINTNLCYSNVAARNKIIKSAVDFCKRNRKVDYLHIWLADAANNHCECKKCAEKRPSDWYLTLLNEIDDKLTKSGIKTKIVFLLYMDLLWEPLKEKFNNPDRFVLMFAPITRNYGQNYSDCISFDGDIPQYNRNQIQPPSSLALNLEHLRRWQACFDGDSFDFDYHLMWEHIVDLGYEKCAAHLFRDMQDLHKIGLNGMISCQVQRCFFPDGLPFYMMASALWDRNSDYEVLADEYFLLTYGKDGKEARECLSKISRLFNFYGADKSNVLNGKNCENYDELKKTMDVFKRIIHRNVAIESSYADGWKILLKYTEYSEKIFMFFYWAEKGNAQKAEESLENALDFLCVNENEIQKHCDVFNTVRYWKSRFKNEFSVF